MDSVSFCRVGDQWLVRELPGLTLKRLIGRKEWIFAPARQGQAGSEIWQGCVYEVRGQMLVESNPSFFQRAYQSRAQAIGGLERELLK